MKNILFILGDFYPRPTANGICVNEVINECRKQGYNVFCLANKQYGSRSGKLDNGVQIEFVRMPVAYYLLDRQQVTKNKVLRKVFSLACKVSNAVLCLMRIPNFPIQKNHVNRYCKAANKIIKENHIDIIVGENTPANCAYAGAILKKEHPEITYVSYFLDPLYGAIQHRLLGKKKSDQRTRSIEQEIITESDLVIMQNEHRKHFRSYLSEDKAKKTVYLGVPLISDRGCNGALQAEAKREGSAEKKKILYAGNLSTVIRDPTFILNCFRYVRNAELVMYVPNQEAWLHKLVEGNPNVQLHGKVPHSEIAAQMKKMDAFLNIGNSIRDQAPSKIMEYISYGKPIITTYREDYDTSLKYVKDYPHCLALDEREGSCQDAANKIEEFMAADHEQIPYSQIEKKYYTSTPQAFVNAMNEAEQLAKKHQ